MCAHKCVAAQVWESVQAWGGQDSLSGVFYNHFPPYLLSQGPFLTPASLTSQLA